MTYKEHQTRGRGVQQHNKQYRKKELHQNVLIPNRIRHIEISKF